MKIPAIMNRSYNNYNSTSSRHSKQNVNFNGQLTVSDIQKFPLSKKLSHLFAISTPDNLIAVGRSFKEILDRLSNIAEDFSDLIGSITFIKDTRLSVPLIFKPTLNDMFHQIKFDDKNDFFLGKEIVGYNLGEMPISMKTNSEVEVIPPELGFSVEDLTKIYDKNVSIDIEIPDFEQYDNEDLDLLSEPKNYTNTYIELIGAAEFYIKTANADILEKISSMPPNLVNSFDNQDLDIDTEISSDAEMEKEIENLKKSDKVLSFKDIGGLDETINQLKKSVLYPIKYPFAYENVNLNRGIILHGKPGTGKTLLAEALAGECDANFIKISGTDLEAKYVGETEAKWRELFENAIENQPSIIFIDEFDAIVKERGSDFSSGHSDKVVNQILSLMSDLEKSNNDVFVIATTNKLETIDNAVKRSGRFGKQIEVLEPDKKGLSAIFDVHTRNKSLSSEFDKEALINEFFKRGFTGADVKHVVNEAHTNSWSRVNIYEKMENGTISENDIADIKLVKEDFDIALQEWDKSHQANKIVNTIGYKR